MNKIFKEITNAALALVLTVSMFPAETLAAFGSARSNLAGERSWAEETPIEEIDESESDLLVEEESFVEDEPQMEDGSSPEQPPEMPEADDMLVSPDILPESTKVNETEDDADLVELMATSYTSGDYTYTLSSSNATIIGYTGDAVSISVPDAIDGYTVTGIGSAAFRNKTSIVSITFPDTITSISSNAFYGCTSLTSLNMSTAVTSIGSNAFYNCFLLTELTIPASISSVSSNAFYNSVQRINFSDGLVTIPSNMCYGATNLREVRIPDSVTKINNDAFRGCTNLVSVSLPKRITSMGNNVFYGCTSLSSINIPTTVTSIGSGTFYNCSSLTEVTIPSGITSMGSNSFYNSVKKIIFADGVVTIPSNACYSATNLTEVSIPSSVTKISDAAFRGCTNLTSISLPNGITSIGSSVFYGCTSLSNINMPTALTSIGSSAFYNCSLLAELTIPASILSVSSNAFYNSVKQINFSDGLVTIPSNMCYGATNLTEVSVPSSVTKISDAAFRGCKKLTSISLPEGITNIGNNAFYGCTALNKLNIPTTVTSIGSSAFYNCSALKEVTIPSGITSMGNNAFYNSVQKISFSAGLQTIPSSVCYGATNLTEVSVPSGVTAIGNDAFRGCKKLTSISLPNEITSIGNYSFYGCTVLNKFNIPNMVISIGSSAFYNCSSMTEFTIPGSVTSIGDSAFRGCTQLTKVILKEGIVSTGNSMFYGCSALASVNLPSTLRIIGRSAFYNCTGLSSVVMAHNTSEDAIISIGINAFYNCSAMAAFDVPLDENVSIGNNAFYNCVISGICGDNLRWVYDIVGQLLTITGNGDMAFEKTGINAAPWHSFSSNIRLVILSDGSTSIADYSFAGCYNLKSVVIPDSVKTIGRSAFDGCTSLLRAEISSNLTSLGNEAFQDCDALDTIIFCGDAPSIGNNALPSGGDVTIYYPKSSTAWASVADADKTTRNYTSWDDTLPTRDIALVLDCSGSMSGSRIAGLKTAVNAFINQTGGRLTNTKISIISFTSSAAVRTGFTTDVIMAMDIINGLTAGGGTTYVTALNSANSLLESSSADIKSIIFFSDGEPGDSTSSIYSTAAAIRGNGYFVYTVGLCSAGTSYEQILINVAGSETNYFPAANIDELVDLFLAIDDNIGEENATEVVIERNGSTYNLLTKAQSFEADSTESVNIVVTPYWGGAVPGSIRLTQNGKTISSNTTGKFENLIPAQVFSPGKPIYMVMLDADGNIAAIKKLLMEVKADYLEIDEDISVPNNKYCIHVVNEDGYPLSGAIVTWNNSGTVSTQQTDSGGNVFFDLFTIDEPVISVTLKNFITWTNENSNWKKSDKRYDTVVLYPESYGGYKLKSARYSNSSSMSNSVDLLTATKKLNLKNDGNLIGDMDFGNFYLTCAALDSNGVDHYELWQNKNKITESQDGNFGKLSVTSFSKDGGCFVRVVSAEGKKVDTSINLQFAENAVNKESQISLTGNSISFKVGDDVPYLGGHTVDLKLPSQYKVTALVSDSKIQFGFNLNVAGGKSEAEQLKNARDLLRKVVRAGNFDLGHLNSQDRKIYESLIKDKNTLKFFKNGQVNFLGYAEADLGSSTAKGQLMFQFKVDAANFEYNTWVVVVPITVQVKLGLEATLGGEVTYDWANATLLGGLDLSPSAKLTAFGGVGISTYVGAGAYGSAELKANIRIIGSPGGIRTVDLTGELGVKAYLGWLTYQHAFAHNTWHLYTANSVRGVSLMQEEEVWNEGIYDASQYDIGDLSYLSRESAWMGEERVSLMNASARTSFASLLTDTYRNAQPTMVSANNALYAAFIRADQATGTRYVVMTKFDGRRWTEPIRVDSGAICDAAPSLCTDGNGKIWLTYARTTKDTDKSLVDYAQSQEIVVGIVNPDTLAFTTAKIYSGTGYAHLQTMELIQNSPVLAWVDSIVTDDNSVLCPASGTIRYAIYSSGGWSEAITLANVNSPIDSLTIGEVNRMLAAAYLSGDTLYQANADGTTVLATNVTGRVRYGTLPGTNAADFLWNGDGVLTNSSGASVSAEGITHEYVIVGNNIYYSAETDESANLMVLQYDNGNWSLPIQLTDEDRYLENLSVTQMNGQEYVLGMHTAADITEGNVEDAKNLVWSRVMPVSDLRLDDISYDDNAISAGDTVPVTLTVTNAGDHEVSGINVTLGGLKVKTETCSLLPGQSMEIETSLICPDMLTTYTYAVSESGVDDYTPHDNTVQAELGYADVETELVYQQIGVQKTLLAFVTNIGVENASGRVVFYDANGTAVAENTFEQLVSGNTVIVAYDLPLNFSGINGGDVSVAVTLNQEERYTYNNSASYHIIGRYDIPSARIENISINGTDVKAQINCDEGTPTTAYCAYYNDLGNMLCVKMAALEAGKTNTQLFSYSGMDAEYVKIFVWDTNFAPMCAAERRFLQ